MGKLIVMSEWKLARDVRAEHELVVPRGDRYTGRVAPAPTLEDLEGEGELEEPLGGPRGDGSAPGWGWRWL